MRRLSVFLCGMALVLAIAGTAHAAVLHFEGFEDASGFTIGGGWAGHWGTAPLAGTGEYPSNFQQGGSQADTIFYGAYAREYMGAPAATMTILLPDLSGYTNLKLTVALAAAGQIWEYSHRDSLHIIGGTTTTTPVVDCSSLAGCMPVTGAIDSFLPDGYPGYLQSQVDSSIDLQPQFQDFEYTIDSSLKSITFAFASTAGVEVVGIDSVTITGDPIVVPVAFDIKPQSCPNPINVASRSVLPAAILGTAEFDVTTIDPVSIRVAGVAVIQWALADVATPYTPSTGEVDAYSCTALGPDGFKDLTLTLDTQQVAAALGAVNGGDVLSVPLTGNLLNGTPIQGQDVVVILKKGK